MNIHLITTPEVSRIVLREKDKKIVLHTPITQWHGINQHIYITSNDKALEPEWGYIPFEGGTVKRIGRYFADDWKKIILTTDPKLIEDGIQAIDDTFLEWFVKNQSCEEVEVKKECCGQCDERLCEVYDLGIKELDYKIILPRKNFYCGDEVDYDDKCLEQCKNCNDANGVDYGYLNKEEPEKETLEEAAERHHDTFTRDLSFAETRKESFIKGVKYQQEQDKNKFSEEDMNNYAKYCTTHVLTSQTGHPYLSVKEWVERNKNK